MSNNLKIFLKALTKTGYPNPNVHSVAKLVGYDLDNFLPDLEKELGEEGVVDFCKKGLDKLQGQEGIRVELEGPYGEFVYVKIKPKYKFYFFVTGTLTKEILVTPLACAMAMISATRP